jgi:hypothetical protein
MDLTSLSNRKLVPVNLYTVELRIGGRNLCVYRTFPLLVVEDYDDMQARTEDVGSRSARHLQILFRLCLIRLI